MKVHQKQIENLISDFFKGVSNSLPNLYHLNAKVVSFSETSFVGFGHVLSFIPGWVCCTTPTFGPKKSSLGSPIGF